MLRGVKPSDKYDLEYVWCLTHNLTGEQDNES